MAKGDTKTNQYLDIAANGTRADLPADTCCETRTQALIRGVAERVMNVEDEVEEIKNNPDVVDIVATYAALQAYDTSHLTNDDVIRVLADETHDGQSTYYRWNSPNAGWNYIGTVGDYYTKTQVDTLLNGKQNVLTFDNAPTANSTNPVTSEGIKTYVDNKARTFQPYPSTVNTTGTTQQFISSIQALNAPAGTAYLGTVELTDLPASLIQEEVQVYVYDNNLIYCIMYSADAAPYVWWCNSYDYRGWEAMSAIYTAGSNVQISNNNVVSATDTTYSNFTGTDGTAAGAAGLVPAPATTDAGKVLGADGSWVTAGGGASYTAGDGIDITNNVIKATNTGKARVLTSADYDFHRFGSVDDGVALWRLSAGVYYSTNGIKTYNYSGDFQTTSHLFIVYPSDTTGHVEIIKLQENNYYYTYYTISRTNGNIISTNYGLSSAVVVNNLTSTSTITPLSANQGKVLKDLVDGNLGKAKVLTTTDYNYNTSTGTATDPNCVALWLLEPGLYTTESSSVLVIRMSSEQPAHLVGTFIVGETESNYRTITQLGSTLDGAAEVFAVNATSGALRYNYTLASRELIDNRIKRNAGAPTTSTVGTVGQLLEDTTNGKLYICTDATNPYVWEEVGAGGSGPTVVQTTGTSQSNVMSQNAVSGMIWKNTSTENSIRIGQSGGGGYHSVVITPDGAFVNSNVNDAVAIGPQTTVSSGADNAVAIGNNSHAAGASAVAVGSRAHAVAHSVAIGRNAKASVKGQFDISTRYDTNTDGYNNSQYRLLTGLYDPQSDHDAATKGYVDTAVASAGAPVYTNSAFNNLWENA